MAGPTTPPVDRPGASSRILVVLAWTAVGIPLAWGIYQTLKSAVVLFK